MLLGTLPHSSPKMSEMCEFVLRNKVSLAFIIETWLQSFIAVSIIDIPGYSVLRKIRYKQLALFNAASITRHYRFSYALNTCRGGFPP